MFGKIKYSKIAVVIFLTVLIWVYADLALDETHPVSGAISVGESRPSRWVTFGGKASISIDNIVLKGPAAKITKVKQKLKDRSPSFEFFLDPEQEGMVEPNEYPLDVQSFLRKSDQIRQFGVTVESCKPATLTVKVVELVEKSLTVQCVDESDNSLKPESIDPPISNILVPEEWGRDKVARVRLKRSEIEEARNAGIEKKPYIVLPDGQTRQSRAGVKIKMPPEEDRLIENRITNATLAIALSPTLAEEYYVQVTNLPQVLNPFDIRATPAAKRAYELQQLPLMTLYIFDNDTEKGQQEQRREVVYNFPEEFVRKGEIELKNPEKPAEAIFKLIQLPSAESP